VGKEVEPVIWRTDDYSTFSGKNCGSTMTKGNDGANTRCARNAPVWISSAAARQLLPECGLR
jgi:hypothetical protein